MKKLIFFVVVFGVTLLTLSCQSGRGPEAEAKKAPIVEAYLEFGGPAQKWVGPGSWLVYVNAKQGPVEVKVAAESPAPEDYKQPERKIASEEKPAAEHKAPTFDEVRAQLSGLAVQIADDESDTEACLNWIRVKLVREDGTTVEKEGCRNARGWSGRVSALAAEWAPVNH